MRALLQAGATASLKSKKDVWRFPANKTAAELAVLFSHMYDSTYGRPSGLCSNFLHALFGASLRRIQRARVLVESFNGSVPATATAHGNTGNVPHNKTRAEVLASLRQVRRRSRVLEFSNAVGRTNVGTRRVPNVQGS